MSQDKIARLYGENCRAASVMTQHGRRPSRGEGEAERKLRSIAAIVEPGSLESRMDRAVDVDSEGAPAIREEIAR